MDRLPAELTAQITSYLQPHEIVPLHGVSRRLRLSTRSDDLQWKQFVYDSSSVERIRLSKRGLPSERAWLAAARGAVQPTASSKQETFRNWDKAQPPGIDWYNEYIQRHSPISLSWLEQTYDEHETRNHVEMRGMGILHEGDAGTVVAPLEDGSVAIWDLRNMQTLDPGLGRILGRSKSGLLSTSQTNFEGRRKTPLAHEGIVENVSIDQTRRRAFFGVHSYLHEVDLNTLQVVSRTRIPFTIAALSEMSASMPLTVATNMSLHMLDTRSSRTSSVEIMPLRDHHSAYATLFKPGWLSILQVEDNGGQIYLAGRDSHIIRYDRKMWPKRPKTVYSGASLACLTKICTSAGSWKLAACGEYKGRGSLELYNVADAGAVPVPAQINRQTASSAKLLSVLQHGSRIAFSDADGIIKWMDCDGVTEERRFSLNKYEQAREKTYGSFDTGAELVRKLMAVGESRSQYANRNDLLFWTGERIGLLEFRPQPRFKADISDQLDEVQQREGEYLSAFSTTLYEHLNAVNLLPMRSA